MNLADLTEQELLEGLELAGDHLLRLRAEIEAELASRERCAWLVIVGHLDDDEPVLAECGAGDLSEHDGLCQAHTRGESLEDYYSPFGAAWQEEMSYR